MAALLRWWAACRAHRAELRADADQVSALTWAWRLACIGAGLGREIGTVSGPTTSTPRLVHVALGPPTVLLVELMPGQLAADVLAAAGRLAPHLGARSLRVGPHSHRHVLVQLLHD
ncbi:MAG: hypothetical protein JHC71_12705, partial [Blastococcus sp.]|nr:hypothetical protein [Blastococcus sp.]